MVTVPSGKPLRLEIVLVLERMLLFFLSQSVMMVVGAGSVVTKDITEPGTYAGNPARRLK